MIPDPRRPLTVVVVHYRSGGGVAELFADLAMQRPTDLDVLVVENGDDGSLDGSLAALGSVRHEVLRPHHNSGYTGGNNLAFAQLAARPDRTDVLVVNPDVRLSGPDTLARLRAALAAHPEAAAVGPAVFTPSGRLEHVGSMIDEDAALAVHVRTDLADWPADVSAQFHPVPWLNGCCWLLRAEALEDIGPLDDRFFLFFEEVDWAIRAADKGWGLAIVPGARVRHVRSASFGTSQKGAYYYWRNNALLFRLHHRRHRWVAALIRRWTRFVLAPRHVRSGASAAALHGAFDALRGRTGPRPGRGGP